MSDPIFDTDIVVDWLCARPEAASELSRYPRHRLSRLSWTEILSREPVVSRAQVQALLSGFEVLEIDSRVAAAAADLRHRLKLSVEHAFILATAQVNGAILVTRNIFDFPASMPGVRIPYTL